MHGCLAVYRAAGFAYAGVCDRGSVSRGADTATVDFRGARERDVQRAGEHHARARAVGAEARAVDEGAEARTGVEGVPHQTRQSQTQVLRSGSEEKVWQGEEGREEGRGFG